MTPLGPPKPPWTFLAEVYEGGAIYDPEWPHGLARPVTHRHFTLTDPDGRKLVRDSQELGPAEDFFKIRKAEDDSWIELEFWGQEDNGSIWGAPWEHIILRAPYIKSEHSWLNAFGEPEIRLREIQVGVDDKGWSGSRMAMRQESPWAAMTWCAM